MQQKKILILIPPFWGHINPLIGITKKLVEENYVVIFYALSEFKDAIVKTGAEYKEYPYFPFVKADGKSDVPAVIVFFTSFLEIADKTIPYFVDIFETEKPDLIIYDLVAIYSKYLLIHLQHRYQIGASNLPPPKALIFCPSFGLNDGIFPKENVSKTIIVPFPTEDVMKSFVAHAQSLSDKYSLNLPMINPIEYILTAKEKLVIVSTFRELQPKGEKFDKPYVFVGNCSINENRKFDVPDLNIKALLDTFDPVNPVESLTISKTNKILVYASLGTIFNENAFIFECIISAIRTFEQEGEGTKCNIKSSQICIIISMGHTVYNLYQEKIANENYNCPENVFLLPWVPQLYVLERASLFISHCGMNSVHESIHFGVPLVCIPQNADQPMVAHRVADELHLGINLDTSTLTSDKVRKSIHQVLKDERYRKNMVEFSKISRGYSGIDTAVEEISKYIAEKS